MTDYDFESVPAPADLADRMPHAARVPGSYSFFQRAHTNGLNGHHPKRGIEPRRDAQRRDATSGATEHRWPS